MEMLGYAAAYSPRSARAFDLDLPFDATSGALDETRLRALAGVRPRRARAGRGRTELRPAAVALSRLRPAGRVRPRHRRARRRASAFATPGLRSSTRNSTTTTATSATATRSRCRRWPPFWIRMNKPFVAVCVLCSRLRSSPCRRIARAGSRAVADARDDPHVYERPWRCACRVPSPARARRLPSCRRRRTRRGSAAGRRAG